MHTDAQKADFQTGPADSMEKEALGPVYSTVPHVKPRTDLDVAFEFIQNNETNNLDLENIDLAKLRRKIDWHIVPIMFLCYTIQYIDKVNINYAGVMGIKEDLHLVGNDFSNATTAFMIAYLIAEIPNGFVLQKLPPGKWLGLNVIFWGITTACTAASTNYQTLLLSRIFLGIFEASIAPSLMILSSQWYTRSEQAPRFSFWYCGVGIAQILGGLVSFGFQHVGPDGLAGWRLMFIVLGIVTVIIGLLTAWILPDSPMSATFMTETEKLALLHHVGENRTGIHNRHVKFSQILELLLDPQIWLMVIVTILISVSSGVITLYSAQIIRSIGFSSKESALLNMPSGIVSLITIILVGSCIRFTSNRWAWLVACCIPGIIGGALMSFAPASNKAALLAGIYLVNSIIATLIIIFQWTMSNVAGHTKRVLASALIAGSFSVGGIIGPQTFQAKDAPGYRPAKITVLATQASGAAFAVILFIYYSWANKVKDERQRNLVSGGVVIDEVEDIWGNLTDKQNIEFRYVY